MENTLRVIIAAPQEKARDTLKKQLLRIERVVLEADYSSYGCFAEGLLQRKPDVGILLIDEDPSLPLKMVRQIFAKAPDSVLFVASSSSDGNVILQCMRAGVSEFLTAPVCFEELLQALNRTDENRRIRDDARRHRCSLVAVAGSAGGVGTTSLAVNLGCALASVTSHSVALIDLDLNLGDTDICLDTIAAMTLIDLAESVDRLDEKRLRRSLVRHATGLHVLSRPLSLTDQREIDLDKLHRLINLLEETFSHVIFDLSKGYTAIDQAVLSRSDQILLMTHLDPSGLHNVIRLFAFFDEVIGCADKVRLVLNHVNREETSLSLKKAAEIIGRNIDWEIPCDRQALADARRRGIPLIEQAPRAAITDAIVGLSNTFTVAPALATIPAWQRSGNPVSQMPY